MRAATNAAACSLTISVAEAPDFSYDTESLEELEEIKREEDLERREAEQQHLFRHVLRERRIC